MQANYRVDANDIGIAGHSSGGDFAVDTLLRKTTPFTKFIVGSFGTDVLEETLAAREQAFAETDADKKLEVFCGYGGAELADPFLQLYVERGVVAIGADQAGNVLVAVPVRLEVVELAADLDRQDRPGEEVRRDLVPVGAEPK